MSTPVPSSRDHTPAAALLLVAIVLCTACDSEVRRVRMVPAQREAPPAPVTAGNSAAPTGPLRLTHRISGVQSCLRVVDGRWYQADGTRLLALDERGAILGRLDFGAAGGSGPIIDMCAAGDRLFVVLEDTGVAVVVTTQGDEGVTLLVEAFDDADRIGIAPRSLARVRGEVYVSGVGGVVRLRDRAVIFERDELVSRVAATASGLVACVGRRVYALESGDYLGSASDLEVLPSEYGLAGMLAFVRRADSGGRVGLMRPTMREVDAGAATVMVPGTIHRIRLFDGRLWVVADGMVRAYRVTDQAIEREIELAITGVRDVDGLPGGMLAVCGTFGRGVIEIPAPGSSGEPVFVMHEPAPGDLRRGRFDGRYALLEGAGGAWLYHPGRGAEPVGLEVEDEPPALSVRTLDGAATISPDGRSVVIETEGQTRSLLLDASCLAAVEGDVWIGHDRGISVVRMIPGAGEDEPNHEVVATWRIVGNVIRLWPLLRGEGAVFVSDEGGVGVLQWGVAAASAE